jgi:hypothetical protein
MLQVAGPPAARLRSREKPSRVRRRFVRFEWGQSRRDDINQVGIFGVGDRRLSATGQVPGWLAPPRADRKSSAVRETSRGDARTVSTEPRLTSCQPITRRGAVRHKTPKISVASNAKNRASRRAAWSGHDLPIAQSALQLSRYVWALLKAASRGPSRRRQYVSHNVDPVHQSLAPSLVRIRTGLRIHHRLDRSHDR